MPRSRDGQTLIGVHLDLKGVMFRPAYIPQLLADLSGRGVNAVLVEYEDIFPFNGIDLAWDDSVVWSRATLKRFLAEAAKNHIEVIPLQQCLGHFEYVFRWRRYRKFALDLKYPSTVDVTNPKAVGLIHEMLRQVIAAHPESRYVHLGMDEAHALVAYCKANKRDVVEMFLHHLSKLCDICEAYGKTPIIWSDMLEDYMNERSLKLFEKFRDRVVLCPWDYGSAGETIGAGRITGFRASRAWLDAADAPEAPTLGAGTTFIEDIPKAVRRLVQPYLHGSQRPVFTSMFQADLWTKLGFRVLGATAIRCSTNLATLPLYIKQTENIRAWGRAIKRTKQLGLVGTSWARGTSWCPPGFSIDLTWPLIDEMARAMGAKPGLYFKGIPAKTADRIIKTLGRSRADWRLEGVMANEMDRLAPRLKGAAGHRYEWESIALMARVMQWQRRAEYNILEVDFFDANNRPVDSEWQRRLDEQAGTLRDSEALRRRVKSHFSRCYHGDAFEEWVRDLFDLHVKRIRDGRAICRKKLRESRRFYASR
ncbi:MAG: family 20 glycosylhydrolase [Planctomycetes bacterium]|nr:family 20 glycosylhydrolase [Planctomycetota bacterium]